MTGVTGALGRGHGLRSQLPRPPAQNRGPGEGLGPDFLEVVTASGSPVPASPPSWAVGSVAQQCYGVSAALEGWVSRPLPAHSGQGRPWTLTWLCPMEARGPVVSPSGQWPEPHSCRVGAGSHQSPSHPGARPGWGQRPPESPMEAQPCTQSLAPTLLSSVPTQPRGAVVGSTPP